MSFASNLRDGFPTLGLHSQEMRRQRFTQLVVAGHLFTAVALPAPLLYVANIPVYIIDLTALLVIGWALFAGKWTIELPNRRIVGLFSIFLLCAFISLFQGLALSGFSVLYIYTMGRLLINVAAPIALLGIIQTRGDLRIAVGGLTFGMVAIGILGIMQIFPNDFIEPFLHAYYPGQTRADGYVHHRVSTMSLRHVNRYAFATWYTANPYAGVLAMTILFPFVAFITSLQSAGTSQPISSLRTRDNRAIIRSVMRFVSLAVPLSVGLAAFVFAETRAPALVLGPIILYMILRQMTIRQIVISGLFVGACLFILQNVSSGPTPTSFLNDLQKLVNQRWTAQSGLSVRLQSHVDFASFALTHPLQTAIGFGPDVDSIAKRGVGGPTIIAAGDAVPLNSVLGLILNYGILGTAAYFAIAVYAIWSGRKRLKHIEFRNVSDLTMPELIAYTATAALIVGLFLQPLDSYWAKGGYEVRHLFWGILAVQQAALCISRGSSSEG